MKQKLLDEEEHVKGRIILLVIIISMLLFVAPSCSPADDTKHIGLGISFRSFQKHGGWIYYVNYSTGRLWRVSADGEEKMQIGDDHINSFVVYEDRVLYTIGLGWGLCSIRTDGSDKIISPDSDLFGLRARKMDVADEWVYVLGFSKNIFKIKSDGSEYTRLNDHDVYDFCIDGEWIYCLEEKEDEKFVGFQLWRMQKDGTQKQQLMQEASLSTDYDENWIYYIDNDDENIYKVPIYGTEKQRILECDSGLFLKVIEDWVYYEDRGDKPGIYKVKKDGSERTFITNDTQAIFYAVWDNWLLCIGDAISVIRVSESEETDEIIKDIMSDWSFIEIYE